MKKLALATAFVVSTLASTAVLANSVTVGTGLTGSTGPVSGNWLSFGTSTLTNAFTILNPNSLMMIVSISSQPFDPSSHPYSNYKVSCNAISTNIRAGSSFVCKTNANVTISSLANATNKQAAGSYQLIFEKSGCTTNCSNS